MTIMDIFAILASIIGMLTGLSGLIISLINFRSSRLETIKEYYSQGDRREYVEARKLVYNSDPDGIYKIEPEAVQTILFFNYWGALAYKKYLPMWIFYDISSVGVIKLYENLASYITDRRCGGQEEYGRYFEWLYLRIKQRKLGIKRHITWS